MTYSYVHITYPTQFLIHFPCLYLLILPKFYTTLYFVAAVRSNCQIFDPHNNCEHFLMFYQFANGTVDQCCIQ